MALTLGLIAPGGRGAAAIAGRRGRILIRIYAAAVVRIVTRFRFTERDLKPPGNSSSFAAAAVVAVIAVLVLGVEWRYALRHGGEIYGRLQVVNYARIVAANGSELSNFEDLLRAHADAPIDRQAALAASSPALRIAGALFPAAPAQSPAARAEAAPAPGSPPAPIASPGTVDAKPRIDPPTTRARDLPSRDADDCDIRELHVGEGRKPTVEVSRYVSTFKSCRRTGESEALATRSMIIGGEAWLLIVDPQTLATRLQRDGPACWSCQPTTDEEQKTTRLIHSVDRAATTPGVEHRTFLQNAGLRRGQARGDFVTGDLCPSPRPLDRRLFNTLAGVSSPTPVALSITGLWLENHEEDFRWLQGLERAGKIDIVWINHSFHHPYAPRQPLDHTFLLTKDLDLNREILDTERLLIGHGGIPSMFFRFPGLISSKALMDIVRKHHLISLGAEAWLAKGERPREGSIILVHPNGNEEIGLDIFEQLYRKGSLSLPLEPITKAP